MGKLNFWQWLGVVLLIAGVVWYILDPPRDEKNPPAKPNPTQPAAPPATQVGL